MVDHSVLESIIEKRPFTNPIWKMAITPSEYDALKKCLCQACGESNLYFYPNEAAICYAEWWRTEYDGGPISELIVSTAIGLPVWASKDFYHVAKGALHIWNVPLIRHRNTLKFRTLLLQGGLPMKYVMNNMGSYKKFLVGLISELSQINIDWEDTSIIPRLNSYWYLSKSFRNDDIYSLSLQIARAIIEERVDLLPYDSNSVGLDELTKALRAEWKRAQRISRRKPLSFIWEMRLREDEERLHGRLMYSLENVRNLYASSLAGFNSPNCYQFDLFVSKQYVATYKRVTSDGEDQVFRRMNANNVYFEWKGEPFIEVKVKTDIEETFFVTVIGCYPPDFSCPQQFLKKDNVYVQRKNDTSEDNIVVFSDVWDTDVDSICFDIAGESYNLVHFEDTISLHNVETGESKVLVNKSSCYTVEYRETFLDWLEDSNQILINKVPYIAVYDENDLLLRTGYSISYRRKNEAIWKPIHRSLILPTGLVEIKVSLPDGQDQVKTFYSIGNLSFTISSESPFAGVITANCEWGEVYPIETEGIKYESFGCNIWCVSRPESDKFPPTCTFRILHEEDRPLDITISSPFKGSCLVDENGKIVRDGKTLSMSNLLSYRIIERGGVKQDITFSFTDRKESSKYISYSTNIGGELVPLSNFEDSINRLFDLYGGNPFDRTNAVTLKIGEETYNIRTFTLDTEMSETGSIKIIKLNQNPLQFPYEGKLFACPAVDPGISETIGTIELERIADDEFVFPNDCFGGYIVFSDVYDRDRIVPKFYKLQKKEGEESKSEVSTNDFDVQLTFSSFNELRSLCSEDFAVETIERSKQKKRSIMLWSRALEAEDAITGASWEKVVEYMAIATEYRLPFSTFNTLNAVVSKPSLFAKMVLRMFMDGKKDDLVNSITKIEREYALAVHWMRPRDFAATIDEIYQQPTSLIGMLISGYCELLKELLTVTMDKECATIVSAYIMNNKDKDKLTPIFFTYKELQEFRSRAKGKAEEDQDLPNDSLELLGRYYEVEKVSRRSCRTTLVNAPLYVYEYLTDINDSLWSSSSLQQRRVINFYRRYFLRTYCEILSIMFK